jgi:hypothetical protein
MKKIFFTILLLMFTFFSFSQINSTQTNGNIWVAKEFSKSVALFRAKSFLYRKVLGSEEKLNSFEIMPLAAASSGELTTLLYQSYTKDKEGMILGFFGDYWNDSGVSYQGYAFRNFSKEDALSFLNKISQVIENHRKYLKEDPDNNNIYFSFQDIDVLIYASEDNFSIRLFWNHFDSSWEKTAFDRSKRRFESNLRD